MSEQILQEKYLLHFLTERPDGLRYNEVKANTVSKDLIIEEDLRQILSNTDLNKASYMKLLRRFRHDEAALMKAFVQFLKKRILEATNMAIFFNTNKSVTFEGVKLHLFYPSGSEYHGDTLFEQNIFSVVQELPYSYTFQDKRLFVFRPDLCFFLNGLFIGYSELKSNFNNQNARNNGRSKVLKDYREAVLEYLEIARHNDVTQTIRKDFLKIFEKAIHITTTDLQDTYIMRNIAARFEDVRSAYNDGTHDYEEYRKKAEQAFKPYPLRHPGTDKTARFEEVFRALYAKEMIERDLLYYNFIEREFVKDERGGKSYKEKTGRLICPRPKQKFGVDKIMDKIDELLEHENDDEYFINKLREQLKHVGPKQREELIQKRLKYQNNKNVYSLLLQYAAGFGKSNIIGWTALQLKDLKRGGEYVYDKVMLVVDRLELRDQLDSKMLNMNINNKMFIEARDKKSFLHALKSDIRIVVVNVQKFTTIREVLDPSVVERLAQLRIAFLIDEIHRSHGNIQHEEMVTLFDELQTTFDTNAVYNQSRKKKNIIIGFTATPSDHTLARFGEFHKYAEAEKIWVPFDSYTMKEAIADGYILNPLKGIVPVSAKMYFDLPENELEGFEEEECAQEVPDGARTGVREDAAQVCEDGAKYRIRKESIYENPDRIDAVAQFVAERLVTTAYHAIRGTGKAMLAASSIQSAIRYKDRIKKHYAEFVAQRKYERFKNAPIYIVYTSDGQKHPSPKSLNGGLSESRVLQNFALAKNGLIIVVDKLQTGFDEPNLHTLFLDKEIRGINAIQTISRVNRKTKYKHDCKIVDFSYKNVNVNNIKAAFEHFSNVVVSDFDPLRDEQLLASHYLDLLEHDLYLKHFFAFREYIKDKKSHIATLLEIENSFAAYITKTPDDAQKLKKKVNKYFHILNLIEFVIELDTKYSDGVFLDFWRRYNHEYNMINKSDDIVDDVAVYFDNRIGIIEHPPEDLKKRKKKKGEGNDSGNGSRQYALDILEVIAKRNQEEQDIEERIREFEEKIETFFSYIPTHRNGPRLIAKMKDTGNAFDDEEIYSGFELIYNAFVRRNKAELGEFFIKEMRDLIHHLCDEFEKRIQ